MEPAARIALVGPTASGLAEVVRQLPTQPEVRSFLSLFADADALRSFQPEVLFLSATPDSAELLGAVRLLRQLCPGLVVVLAATADRELGLAPLANLLAAPFLALPATPGQVAAAMEQARGGGDRPHAELFLDLAHGIADEINNPLMFSSGHLQLLRAGLAPAERDRRDQIDAALAGLHRIQEAVDRLRLLTTAAQGPRRTQTVDLVTLFAPPQTASPAEGTTLASPRCSLLVSGDPEQLAAAAMALQRLLGNLRQAGFTADLVLEAHGGSVRMRLSVAGPELAHWRLPLSFEPYYPNRFLRGRGHGLDLFLAQTVVLAHRGQASARRRPDGALQIEFILPAIAAPE
jgi:signal transduction histidine kinase